MHAHSTIVAWPNPAPKHVYIIGTTSKLHLARLHEFDACTKRSSCTPGCILNATSAPETTQTTHYASKLDLRSVTETLLSPPDHLSGPPYHPSQSPPASKHRNQASTLIMRLIFVKQPCQGLLHANFINPFVLLPHPRSPRLAIWK